MSNHISSLPEELLLEQSLKIKKAARRLVEAQLSGITNIRNSPQTETEDDETKLHRIMEKNPDDRTAVEYLFLMNGLYKHSSSCSSIRCLWSQQCWRMKGLQYRTVRLRERGVSGPAALATLWNRHMELEMHTETCPLDSCVCKRLEQYKYFLMKCDTELSNGKYEQIPMKSGVTEHVLNHTLYVVIDFFKQNFEKDVYLMATKEKRSAIFYLHRIATNTFGGEAVMKAGVEAEAERRKEAAEAAALAAATEQLSKEATRQLRSKLPPGKIGDKIVAATAAERDAKITAALAERMAAACSINSKREFDPGQPGPSNEIRCTKKRIVPHSPPDKTLWMGLIAPGCDHHPTMKCMCTLTEEVVDLALGERKILCRNRTYVRGTPRQAVLDELKRRVLMLIDRRGTESGDLPVVRILTAVVEGVKWNVAYNGDVHNIFSQDQFNSVVTQYMWATLYYPEVQVIMYNFVNEKHSEGATRLESILKEIPVQNVVTLNLKHAQKSEREDGGSLQTKLCANYHLAMQQLIEMKEGSTIWFSGCLVKLDHQSPGHTWRQTLKQDIDRYNKIIAHHSRKIPPTPVEQYQRMMNANMDNLTEEQRIEVKLALKREMMGGPVSQLEYIRAATASTGANSFMSVAPSLTLFNASSHTLSLGNGLHPSVGETPETQTSLNALFNFDASPTSFLDHWTEEQKNKFLGGFEAEMINQDNLGIEWINPEHLRRLTGLTEFNFETDDAKGMLTTGKLPRNAEGKAYVPDELIRMCDNQMTSHIQAAWKAGREDGANYSSLGTSSFVLPSMRNKTAFTQVSRSALNRQREELFGKIREEERRVLANRSDVMSAELRLQFDVVKELINDERGTEELTRLHLSRVTDEFGSEDSMEFLPDENIGLAFRGKPLPPLKELKRTIKTHKKKNTNTNKKQKKK